MKNLRSLLILSAFALVSGITSAQDVSFDMEMYTAEVKEPITMKVMAKGSKVAIVPQNMGEGKMTIIMDNATSKQYMLMDVNGQKMAMNVPVAAAAKTAEAAGKEPKITVTNDKKVIDGFNCTRIVAETDESVSDMWMSEEVGFTYADLFKMMNSSKGPGTPGKSNMPEMKNVKGFPLEMVTKDKKKGDSTTLKIKNIRKGNVDDKVFSMEGYKMMDMGKPGN